MNKDKIKDFIKKNKIAVGVTGTILAVGLLVGVGYGIHSLNNSNSSETNEMIVEANKNSETSKEEVSTTDTKNEDNKNNEDNKELAVNNTDKSSEVNKGEEDKTTSESNTTDDGNKNNSTSNNKQETSSTTSNGENNNGTPNLSNSNKADTSNNSTANISSTHSHSWTPVKQTIHHKEQGHYENVLVKPAWSEKVPVYEERERYICNGCRKDITNNADKHMEDALLAGNTKCGAYHTEWKTIQVGTKVVKHDAVYKKKWVVDKKAYTETKITGYKCGCGATK